MSRFAPSPASLSNVRGKVVVLTGGANGIGAAVVRLLHEVGACVIFGDLDDEAGENLSSALNSNHVHFLKTNVTSYRDNVALFRFALNKYQRVDHALAIAGLVEQGNWFDPALTVEDVETIPPKIALDVNLLGVLYFARIASVYLRQNRGQGEDKSLLLLSSVAGFKESPGLFVYQSAKHGVLGLMRSLRPYLPEACGIRVNAICPWMTATQVTAGIQDIWYAAKLPVNQPIDVARVVMNVTQSEGLNGKAFYVEGGRAWEIEDGINRLEPEWLGDEQSKSLAKGQVTLGNGSGWISKQQSRCA